MPDFDECADLVAQRQRLIQPARHPPLAKQLMALSIKIFGDAPLGWRYPGVVFGSFANWI